jgi:putative phosphoesterase
MPNFTKIGLISDSHDKLATIDEALKYFKTQQVDLIIHCGDWKSLTTVEYFASKAACLSLKVRGVLGNNDRDVAGFLQTAATAPGDFELYVGIYQLALDDGSLLAAYHGHHKPTLRRVLNNKAYSVVALGHTHKPRVDFTNGKLVVNPGSTAFAIPRSKSWQPSVAIVTVSSAKISTEITYLR